MYGKQIRKVVYLGGGMAVIICWVTMAIQGETVILTLQPSTGARVDSLEQIGAMLNNGKIAVKVLQTNQVRLSMQI